MKMARASHPQLSQEVWQVPLNKQLICEQGWGWHGPGRVAARRRLEGVGGKQCASLASK